MPTREDYERFFREADTDGSGELTMEELYELLKKKGFRGSKSEITGYFASCDTSGDKKVTMEEYLSAMGQLPPDVQRGSAMRQVFAQFDKSGDGHIDKSEVKAILQELRRTNEVSEAEAQRGLELMDADGDGMVDYEEYIKFVCGPK